MLQDTPLTVFTLGVQIAASTRVGQVSFDEFTRTQPFIQLAQHKTGAKSHSRTLSRR